MAEAIFPTQAGQRESCAFQEMNLRVGERIELQFIPTSLHPHLFTTVIGYAPGESLLVRTPYVNGLPVNVQEGQPLVVRVFSGTKAFGFQTQVQRNCIAPFLYLHLGFPGEIQCVTVRKDVRVSVSLLAEVRVNQAWQPVRVVDLGVGGALIESAHMLGKAGDALEMRLCLPIEPLAQEATFMLRATLQHEQAHDAQDGLRTVRHGLSFANLPPSEAVCLQNFIYRVQVDST